MGAKLLEINLFGACQVRGCDGQNFELNGAKHKALFALLATAPFGRRSRAFLQQTLWGTGCYDTGRQSLRRALSDIKGRMGAAFAELLAVTHSEVALDLDKVRFIGQPGNGEFLEGFEIREEQFLLWLNAIRANPEQVQSLYSLRNQSPLAPILPMITTLPFRLVSGSPSQALMGDWLAEQICRSLSRSRLLGVISHLSSREFCRGTLGTSALRDKLGVDYCLNGSLRVADGRAVLDVDFIDAASGRILWSQTANDRIDAFFAGDNTAIGNVVQAVGRSIADEAITHTHGRSLAALKDHHLLVAAVGMMHQLSPRRFMRSRELIEEAIRRRPHSAEAHAWFGEWYLLSVFNGWSADIADDTAKARDCTARALDLDPEDPFALTIDGAIANNLMQRLDIAEHRFDQAIGINPNESMSWLLRGVLHAYADRGDAAIDAVDRARMLSPLDPLGYFYDSLAVTAYFSAGRYDRALALADRSFARNPNHVSTLRGRICALHYLGRRREARTAGADLIRRRPDFTVRSFLRTHPAAQFRFGQSVATALRAAGVPD